MTERQRGKVAAFVDNHRVGRGSRFQQGRLLLARILPEEGEALLSMRSYAHLMVLRFSENAVVHSAVDVTPRRSCCCPRCRR